MQLYPQITFEIFNREELYESVEYFRELYKEVYGESFELGYFPIILVISSILPFSMFIMGINS